MDRIDHTPVSLSSRLLPYSLKLALIGYFVSIVLFGHITSTLNYFYLAFGCSSIFYVLMRGEALFDSFVAYLASPLLRFKWLFMIWVFASMFWTNRSSEAMTRIITLLILHLAGFIVYDAVRFRNQFHFILSLIFYATAVGAALALSSAVGSAFWVRSAGLYGNPNTLALTSMVGLLIYIVRGSRSSNFLIKLLWSMLSLIIVAAVFYSASRKGFVAVLFLWSISMLLNETRKRVFMQFASIALIGFLALGASRDFRMRLEKNSERLINLAKISGSASSSDFSLMERSRFISEGLEIMTISPMRGQGLDSFRWLSNRWKYSHNNYIEIGVSLGIVGLLLYYSFFARLLFRVATNILSSGEHRLMATSVCMVFLLDFGYVSYYSKLDLLLPIMFAGFLDGELSGGRELATSSEDGFR